MITTLKITFSVLLVFMSAVVIMTSLESNLFEQWDFLGSIPWMRATLWDFYANVFVIFCWVLYKERNWLLKSLWLIILVTLGSIGSCIYILVALYRLPKNATVKDLLIQQQ